jgi:hypothetical protein
MVATMDAASGARLARLFAAPSKQGMLELDWAEFEDFVQYVFECAGYAVEKVSSRPKHNVDLVLHIGHVEGKVVARVEVRRYQTARLPRARIWQFHGALLGQGNAPGYIVTTSEFTRPAYDAAEATHGKVKLINGERLIRYIRYVSGSRLVSANGVSAACTSLLLLQTICWMRKPSPGATPRRQRYWPLPTTREASQRRPPPSMWPSCSR